MCDIMLDIETLGTKPGSIVFAIGAVPFNPRGVSEDEAFYAEINVKSAAYFGLTRDSATISFWLDQPVATREIAGWFRVHDDQGDGIIVALTRLTDWFLDRRADGSRAARRVWGNGAGFDVPILEAAYRAIGDAAPWEFRGVRCFRTLRSIFPNAARLATRTGTAHNAKDDAIFQAKIAVAILNGIGGWEA